MISKNNWLGKAISMLLAFILSFTTMISGFERDTLASWRPGYIPGNGGNPQEQTFDHFDLEPVATYKLYKGNEVIDTVTTNKNTFTKTEGNKITVTGAYGDGTQVNVKITSRGIKTIGGQTQYRLSGTFSSGSSSNPIYYTLTYPVTFKVDGKDYTVNFSQTLSFSSIDNLCPGVGSSKGIDFKLNTSAVIKEYTVTFINGEETVKTETVAEGGNATAPSVTKNETDYASYTFDKWVDSEGNEVSLNNISEDMTVYASYKENVKKYTIKFLYENGTLFSEKTYAYGDIIVIPDVPEKTETDLYKYENGVWTPAVSTICKGDATYKAGYTETQKEYEISYVVNGKTTTVTLAAGTSADDVKDNAPEVPASYSDEKNVYNFVKWDKAFSKVTGNEVYTAVYTPTARTYTVVFKNVSGKIISTGKYGYGDKVNVPKDPTYDEDKDIYKHSFAGWDKAVSTTCTGDAEYTAKYTDEIVLNYYVFKVAVDSKDKLYDRKYIEGRPSSDFTHAGNAISIIITDENREEYSSLISALQTAFTKQDGYTRYGSNVESVIYDVVDNTFEIAEIERDLVDCWYVVKLEADGWHIDGANFKRYTIKFVDSDDSVISENVYKAGETIVIPANPAKEADETYTYVFEGWDREISETAVADATYKAIYKKNHVNYTISFLDEDGDVISSKNDYHYGDKVAIPANPAKDADETYTYTFAGWDKDVITVVLGNAEYTAKYNKEYIEYTVNFVSEGKEISSKNDYHYGDEVVVPAEPTKESDKANTYKFTGWDKEITTVTGNVTYYAQFKSDAIDYTVTFLDYDGKVISSEIYNYGDTVVVPKDPERAADERYTYKFAGWNKEVVKVEGNATYTATYNATPVKYTIKFYNYDGVLISSEEYEYGETVAEPKTPVRYPDKTYTYTFAGWDKEVTKVTGNAAYTATYDEEYINYTVRFADYDGKEISSKDDYHYGDVVIRPADPNRAADETYTYTFAGWDKDVVKVEGDTTYTATYDKTYIEYTVKFVSDGKEISSKNYHYGDTVDVPAAPTKVKDNKYTYAFAGWDKEITTVTGNATYYAVFESDAIDYNVKFVDYDGTVISSVNYNYGDAVIVPEEPEREADETYIYTFAGWDKDVVKVEGDTTYTATYDKTYIEYTVKFVSDGKEISSKNYHYGDTVDVPAAPTKVKDNKYTYAFAGWDKEITTVTGNATYYAVFESDAIDYNVKFVDYDGTVISSVNYNYGDAVIVPEEPEREADETYTYTFAGWDKEVTVVTEDTTYTAIYEQKKVVPERKPEVEADEDVTDPEPVKPVVPERKPEVEADEDIKAGYGNISLYIALLGLGLVSSIMVLSGKKKEQND